MTRARSFATPGGKAPGLVDAPHSPRATIVLGHGAGAGMTSDFMASMAAALADESFEVVRFDFLYVAAGRKAPDRAPVLEDTFRAVVEACRPADRPLVIGGKSMGGRISSQIAAAGTATDALVFLGYPLHPPGKPERIRDAHLGDIAAPMLFVEGTRDPFCPLGTLEKVIATRALDATVAVIDDGDHSFKVRRASGRSTAEAWAEASGAVTAFLEQRLGV